MVKLPKKTLVTLGAAGVLALGIAVPAAAMAADKDAGTSSSAQQGRQEHQQQLAAALAKELGVDESKVTAALEKVRTQLHPDGKDGAKKSERTADRAAQLKERLAAAVKEGKLTQAEADAITKAAEAGVLGGHTRGSDRNSSSRSGE